MTMSQSQLRRHALAHIRSRVESGSFSDADVERWKDEVGATAVAEIEGKRKPARSSSSAKTTKKEEG